MSAEDAFGHWLKVVKESRDMAEACAAITKALDAIPGECDRIAVILFVCQVLEIAPGHLLAHVFMGTKAETNGNGAHPET